MPKVRVFFVDCHPKRPWRDRELDDAERRAHAARETHRKRDVERHRLQSRHVTSPTSQTILHGADPFDTTSVKIDNTVAGLLHYYVYFYHPTLWPNEMAVLRQGLYTFQNAVNSIMRTVVEDRLTMYCLLSAAACRLQFVDRLPCTLVAGKDGHYMRNALQLLRSRIDTHCLQTSEQLRQLLICIMFLTSAECYRDDVSAAQTHLRAAVGLLERNGGLVSIQDENLRGQLAMSDLYLACVELKPCLFTCDYDPGPASVLALKAHELSSAQCETVAASLLDRGMRIVPLELRLVIEQLYESYSVKSRLQTSAMSASRAMEVTHWITTRNMAIRNRLLALTTHDPRAHALRTAIIMWTLLAMNVTGRAKTVKVMAPLLRSILMQIPTPLGWAGEEDIRAWILIVGFSCAGDGSDVAEWFAEQVSGCASSRSLNYLKDPLQCRQDADRVLAERLETFQRRGFFFDAPVQRSRTRRLAHAISTSFWARLAWRR
ncbi:uncharacterized protein Z520_10716 [Fonsecaea multimorphosa CBS 102226]|uniref:Transcription factor domain-containing protein n=1 Tax=Fonsecaea multimorphosa CBS 102226 TaxID=1442371 RepID=A0A0D2KAN7_9EURO|nr:uncharacterized protein Z520_10716 [Fonsecaea multimorphosa CBS 102226]KIX93538.1 hypothetical protein Z520_10716 [Fonsecaea multimorphosa CBS 102226]OAL18853.1 hypothetical protein AYO22_10182 [Fonsecaea multimorphosa]